MGNRVCVQHACSGLFLDNNGNAESSIPVLMACKNNEDQFWIMKMKKEGTKFKADPHPNRKIIVRDNGTIQLKHGGRAQYWVIMDCTNGFVQIRCDKGCLNGPREMVPCTPVTLTPNIHDGTTLWRIMLKGNVDPTMPPGRIPRKIQAPISPATSPIPSSPVSPRSRKKSPKLGIEADETSSEAARRRQMLAASASSVSSVSSASSFAQPASTPTKSGPTARSSVTLTSSTSSSTTSLPSPPGTMENIAFPNTANGLATITTLRPPPPHGPQPDGEASPHSLSPETTNTFDDFDSPEGTGYTSPIPFSDSTGSSFKMGPNIEDARAILERLKVEEEEHLKDAVEGVPISTLSVTDPTLEMKKAPAIGDKRLTLVKSVVDRDKGTPKYSRVETFYTPGMELDFSIVEGMVQEETLHFQIHTPIKGLKCKQTTYKFGVQVDVKVHQFGDFQPRAEPHTHSFGTQKVPSGFFVRGSYTLTAEYLDEADHPCCPMITMRFAIVKG